MNKTLSRQQNKCKAFDSIPFQSFFPKRSCKLPYYASLCTIHSPGTTSCFSRTSCCKLPSNNATAKRCNHHTLHAERERETYGNKHDPVKELRAAGRANKLVAPSASCIVFNCGQASGSVIATASYAASWQPHTLLNCFSFQSASRLQQILFTNEGNSTGPLLCQ